MDQLGHLRLALGLVWAIAICSAVNAAGSEISRTQYYSEISSGRVLLVARPNVQDPFFRNSVVLIFPSPDDASLIGLIINKAINLSWGKLFPYARALTGRHIPVHFGGPLRWTMPTFLLRSQRAPASMLSVFGDIYAGSDVGATLSFLRQLKSDKDIRVYLGHAAWSTDQLDEEILRGDWYVLPAEDWEVFTDKPELLWSTLLARAQQQAASFIGRLSPRTHAATRTPLPAKSLTRSRL